MGHGPCDSGTSAHLPAAGSSSHKDGQGWLAHETNIERTLDIAPRYMMTAHWSAQAVIIDTVVPAARNQTRP